MVGIIARLRNMLLVALTCIVGMLALQAATAPEADALTPYQQDRVVDTALSYEGMPYVVEGGGYYGLDCSDLTSLAYQSAGIYLTDDPGAQYYESYPVYYPSPGDLVFYATSGYGVDHVGIYVGRGMVIDANSYWGTTIYHDVYDVPGFVGYGRVA
jgi:cell wall-associated NlpC family hydrolase